MLNAVPQEPVSETSAEIEVTSRPGRAAPSKPGRKRFAGLAREVLVDLGLCTPKLREPTDIRRLTRTANRVDALAAAGRLREALELARTTVAVGGPAVPVARLKCALSSVLYLSGRPIEAVIEAEKLLADPDLPEDVHEPAEMVLLDAVTAFEDPWRARDRSWDAEAIVASREARGDEVVVVALTNLAHTAWGRGRVGDALDLIHQAVRLASAGGFCSHRLHPRLWLVGMLTCLRRFEEAEAQLGILRDGNDRLGHIAYAAVFAANLQVAAGRVDDATVEVDAGLAAADAWGTELFTPWALSVLATIALRRGDVVAATRYTEGACRLRAAVGNSYGYAHSAWVAAQVALARGGGDQALRVLGEVLDAPVMLRRLLLMEPAAAAWLVRTSLACGERAHAERVVAQAQHLAADNPGQATLVAGAVHARGLLDRDPNALKRATETHQDPWARASAAEDLAALLAYQVHDDHAVTWYCHAIEYYQQSGSARDAARVRGKLQELGVRMRHRIRTDRRVSGRAGPTNTEHTVTDMARQSSRSSTPSNSRLVVVDAVQR